MVMFTTLSTPLFSEIIGIILGCSKKQMARIDARRIVAMMTYLQFILKRAEGQEIRISLSRYRTPIYIEIPISRCAFLPVPNPAFIYTCLLYFSPKPLNGIGTRYRFSAAKTKTRTIFMSTMSFARSCGEFLMAIITKKYHQYYCNSNPIIWQELTESAIM